MPKKLDHDKIKQLIKEGKTANEGLSRAASNFIEAI